MASHKDSKDVVYVVSVRGQHVDDVPSESLTKTMENTTISLCSARNEADDYARKELLRLFYALTNRAHRRKMEEYKIRRTISIHIVDRKDIDVRVEKYMSELPEVQLLASQLKFISNKPPSEYADFLEKCVPGKRLQLGVCIDLLALPA